MPVGSESSQTEQRTRGSVDTSTLFVAAAASVIAAVVTSKLWASGTLVSTAMTPVIVSLLKEYLQRPVEKIHAVAKAPIVAVRSGTTTSVPALSRRGSAPPPETERRGRLLDGPDAPYDEDYERLDTLMPPGEGVVSEQPYQVYRKRSDRASRLSWWRVGLATGLTAFLVAAAVVTLPEIVGGKSVAGSGKTTLFSHHHKKATPSSDQKTTSTTSTTKDQTTTSTPSSSQDQKTTSTPQSTTSTPQTQQTTPTTSTPSTPAAPTQTSPQVTPPTSGQ
jgi:hypothetical protein